MTIAAARDLPAAVVDRLAVGNRLVVPVGRPGATQTLLRVTRGEAGVIEESLGGVRLVPLVAGMPPEPTCLAAQGSTGRGSENLA